MSKFLRWSWWIVLIALVGCAQLVTPGAKPAPSVSPLASPLASPIAVRVSDVVIRAHRTGGLAGVDEVWTIYGDGRVVYSGRGTGQSKQLSADEMAALTVTLRANFAALDESYNPKNTCCDRFVYEITITLDGQTKAVHTVDGAPNEPPALTKTLAALQLSMK